MQKINEKSQEKQVDLLKLALIKASLNASVLSLKDTISGRAGLLPTSKAELRGFVTLLNNTRMNTHAYTQTQSHSTLAPG